MEVIPYEADDAIFKATRADSTTRHLVYRPDRLQIVLGRASKPAVELNLQACEQDRVPILRRRGGGCAVLLDPGNLIVSAAQYAPGLGDNQGHLRRLNGWLIDGLAVAGISGVERAGISDLVIGDRKIGGACLHRSRDTLLYSASLLFDPRLDRMIRYLAHPPHEPDYRQGRGHAEFVTTLDRHLAPHGIETLVRRLKENLRPPSSARAAPAAD